MNQERTIVFVCEHGSRRASSQRRSLTSSPANEAEVAAVARGTSPMRDPRTPAANGYGRRPGRCEWFPAKLTQADAAGALRVVTFCELPEGNVTAAPIERWDTSRRQRDYAKARDAIVEHVPGFLDELEAEIADPK